MDVLIRDVPADVHAELTRRAAAADKSLRAYLRNVLADHVATPSTEQWLENLRKLEPIRPGAPSGAELVSAARAEDDELVGR